VEFHTVARVGDLAPGQARRVQVGGRDLALFNVGGSFHAVDHACPHRGGPLSQGQVEEGVVTCPLHGWAFDLATGRCVTNPQERVRRYEVRIVEGNVQVGL
jgi:nitrite reductase (NADH) small subunit